MLRDSKRLKSLSISGLCVTEETVQALADLPVLKHLGVSGSKGPISGDYVSPFSYIPIHIPATYKS